MNSFSDGLPIADNRISKDEIMIYLDGLLYRIIDSQQSIENIISGFEKDYS